MLQTTATEFLYVDGTRFAYRRIGPSIGVPLICFQHFTGTMDAWDPAVINALAVDRTVVVFNNKGVGTSNGETADTVATMASDAHQFINALGYKNVDLLGFSLGGMVAQLIAADHSDLVRKVILVGTAPQGGEEHLMKVLQDAMSKGAPDPRLSLFFTPSEASQAAGVAFLKRTSERTADRDPDSGQAIMGQQAKALIGWCAAKDPANTVLTAIKQPVLVVSGSDDTMLPHGNAMKMFEHLSDAQLILYPDSGHGAIFQYHERFVKHVSIFLSE